MANIFDPTPGAAFDAKGAPVEIPQVEQPTPAVEVKTEPVTTDTAPVSEAATPEMDWGTILSEKTGGKFKSWDEITTKLTEEPTSISFGNDESKKVFDYLKEGKVDDVLQVYNEQRRLSSIADMSDADVVKLAMEFKHAGLTTEDIAEEFSSKFSLEKPEAPDPDDYIDEDSLAKAQKSYEKDLARFNKEQKSLDRLLKLEASESRDYLESLRKDIVLPDITPAANKPSEPDYERAIEEQKKYRQEYLTSLEKSSAGFKEIPFKISDEGVSFEGSYQIDDAERQQLQKDLSEKDVMNDLIMSRYIKDDGYDTTKLMEDIYWLKNKEKIITSAVKQALSKGKLENIRSVKNVDLDNQHRDDFTPSTEAQLHEMAKNFFKAG